MPRGPVHRDIAALLFKTYSREQGQGEQLNDCLFAAVSPEKVIDLQLRLIELILPARVRKRLSLLNLSETKFLAQLEKKLFRLRLDLEHLIFEVLPYRWRAKSSSDSVVPLSESEQRKESRRLAEDFIICLPRIREQALEDISAAFEGDPAARSYAEVHLAYPGLLAICSHRLAHELHLADVPILPRIMSEWTHTQTGADIHPGAKIGRRFFIDHCTGVVIGETSVIGDNVRIYQGATLGARNFPRDEQGNLLRNCKRHPTIEDNVAIYANAVILGGDTVIGKGAIIGSGVSVSESVVPGARVLAKRPENLISVKCDVPPV